MDDYGHSHYSHSDRLRCDGRFAYVYDRNGNLIQKGNRYTVNGDQVVFTVTSGDGVFYWEYSYDPLNRLEQVKKNTVTVCDYGYDPEGLRVWKRAGGKTTHYIFEGTEPIFEKQKDTGTGATIAIRSYVYVLDKHLARVDGVIGGGGAVYYYHTDHLGSTKVITDGSGNEIWRADYMAFGRQFGQSGTLEDTHGFTGKEYDRETGLYYFNARWYDPELGRFISEDPVMDPNNPNLYVYCANNPLILTDPTGLDVGWYGEPNCGGNSGYNQDDEEEIDDPAIESAPSDTIGSMSETEKVVYNLQEKYPGMEISVIDDDTIVIETNGCNNENVTIDELGMQLNGEIIIIRKTAVTRKGKIIGTNYLIQINDNLHLGTIGLASNKSKTVIVPTLNAYTNTVTLTADITVLDNGSVDVDMWISFPDSDNEPTIKARIETPNGIIYTDHGIYADDAQRRSWIGPDTGKRKIDRYYPTITTTLNPGQDALFVFSASVGTPEKIAIRYDTVFMNISLP